MTSDPITQAANRQSIQMTGFSKRTMSMLQLRAREFAPGTPRAPSITAGLQSAQPIAQCCSIVTLE